MTSRHYPFTVTAEVAFADKKLDVSADFEAFAKVNFHEEGDGYAAFSEVDSMSEFRKQWAVLGNLIEARIDARLCEQPAPKPEQETP